MSVGIGIGTHTGRAVSLPYMSYTAKVKALAPLAYWPLSETSGTTIADASGNGYTGTYTNVTLGAAGIGDGRTAAGFNGTTSKANVFGAPLAAAFNGAEGSFGMWVQVSAVGVWTDATIRRFGVLQVDTNNRVLLQKNSASNQLIPNRIAGGTSKSQAITSSATTWLHIMTTWSTSGDAVKHYLNGAQQGATGTAVGVWAGTLLLALIGAGDVTPANVWSGNIQHAYLWTSALSAAQVAQLATVP